MAAPARPAEGPHDAHRLVIPSTPAALEAARITLGKRELDDAVELVAGDVHAPPFADDSFAVVHAHQVLLHVADPVAALREMRRVTRPGGVVATCDVSCSRHDAHQPRRRLPWHGPDRP